jgi:outer membrane protein assembly factor BamB
MLRSILLTTVVCLLGPALGPAAKVKVWHHHGPEHYEKAKFKHLVVSSEGALRLSRRVRPLANLDATHVWDAVEDRQGNLFVATGDNGKIYKINAAGKSSVAYTAEDCQVLCLALAGDGGVYAGTGPSGLLVHLSAAGQPRVIARDLGSYVWCLAVAPGGQTIYAGTGPKSRIYQVTPAGKKSVYYATRQEHILCLALADGLLYAGTDRGGLVYRIDPKGKGFVLYQAPQAEVRSLLVAGGCVYAGTSAPTKRHAGAAATKLAGLGTAAALSRLSATELATRPSKKKTSRTSIRRSHTAEPGKVRGATSIPPPATGENSLFRINADGTVRELFREKAMLLSLLRQKGRLYIGTGMDGQLFEVDEATKERSEVARLDHGQIHRLVRRRDGSIVLATGDPGKLYVLEDKYASRGTVISEVQDAKIISKWGSLRWHADLPHGTAVSVAVRTGNLAEPDNTWSDWSEEQTDPQQAVVAAPVARFLQYRVTLTTENPGASPALRGLAIRYMTTNQAPEVESVEVPDLDAVNLDNPKKIKIKWSATDPNEDELTYRLYVRKNGWKNWVLLEEDYDKKTYEWDTTTTPAGIYRVKVVASDQKDNPAKEALTCEKISAPFAVAHVPPTVTLKVAGMEGDKVALEATATDPLVRLTAASFAINGKKWTNVFPTDGLFDSKTERFRFTTTALKPGTYVLVMRVRDAAGNTGSGDIVFTVQARVPRR